MALFGFKISMRVAISPQVFGDIIMTGHFFSFGLWKTHGRSQYYFEVVVRAWSMDDDPQGRVDE